MATDTIDAFRATGYAIAEAIAPTWERRRADIEAVATRFVLPDVDEYLSVIADTAGPIALALRALPESEHAAVKAEVEDSFGRFAADGGYELPAVALCAVAS